MHKVLTKSSFLLSLFAVAFFMTTYFLPGPGAQPEYAGPAATVFSILLGFMVADSKSRLKTLYERLKVENANNLTIYRLSHVFGDKTQSEVRELLDHYLIDQIDYNIEDFSHSNKSFQKLYKYVLSLDPQTDREKTIYTRLVTLLHDTTINRSQIEAVSGDRLSRGQWISISTLMIVTITTIWSMSDGTIWGGIILTALASGVVLMILIMRDMNNLQWGNTSWTWLPLQNLFNDIGLIPYYPAEVLEQGDIKIEKGGVARIAYHPNKYPDMTGKTIKTIKF